uniref:AB hydrolase-1 domain-containing protein n=1 Tax=Oryza sativa subsp. japonica TaxID=39947 RepID=Q60EW7_ORYSJ|nr:hypothetical protein [Oryza sativa Japonica Group]
MDGSGMSGRREKRGAGCVLGFGGAYIGTGNIGKVAVEDRIFGRSAANRVYRVAVRWCAGGSGAAFAAICSAACGWGATKRPVREGRKGRRPAAARERPHPRFKGGQSRLRVEGLRGEGKHRLPSASRLREKRRNGPREELTLALSLIRPANRFTGDALMRDAGLLTKERYGSTRRVFVVVEDDHAIPVEFQRRMVAENPGVEVVDIAGADHMAMISKPAKLADLLSSSPTVTSSTVHATSEHVGGGRVLHHPRPTPELIVSSCVLLRPLSGDELPGDTTIPISMAYKQQYKQ